MNRLTPAYEIKRASVDTEGVFTGYASTFNGGPDAYGDVIAPGAFAKSLAKHKADDSTPAMLWQHNAEEPIGRWLSITEDSNGLAVKGKLVPTTQRGAEALDLLRAGALNGLSIGFTTPKGGYTSGPTGRRLTEVELWEVSLVTFPANTAARVIEVRSIRSIRDFEEHLRESGFAKAAARKLAAGGFPALNGREPGDAGLDELAALLNKRTVELETTLNRKQSYGY